MRGAARGLPRIGHAARPGHEASRRRRPRQGNGRLVERRLCPEHGRGARLLHDVLDRAAAADRDLGRRAACSASRRRAARSSLSSGPDGRRGRAQRCRGCSSVNEPKQGDRDRWSASSLLLIGATTVFGELQDALDRIWRAPAREAAAGCGSLLRARLLSFGMILGIGFLLIVSLVASAAIAALGKWWGAAVRRLGSAARRSSTSLVGFAMTTVVFAMIYKIMPRVHIALARRLDRRRRDGAAVHDRQGADRPVHRQERRGLGLRRGRFAGGAAVWVYYSAQIFLMGAEFTWVYAHRFGSRTSIERPARRRCGQRAEGRRAGRDLVSPFNGLQRPVARRVPCFLRPRSSRRRAPCTA